MTIKIGIIGKGIVGSAVHKGMSKYQHDVVFSDPIICNSIPLKDVISCSNVLFICVPTPSNDNGLIDLSIVDNVVSNIIKEAKGSNKLIIIKSTVIPGTTESYYRKYGTLFPNIKFIYCPEFLDNDTAYEDFINPNNVIIGHTKGSEQCKSILTDIFSNFVDKKYIFEMSSTEAEMVKYMTNSFYVTKVVFANTIYEICKKLDIDYNTVKKAFVHNPRIGDSHFEIFHKGGRGAGGKCLPKDLSALTNMTTDIDISYNILPYIQKLNKLLLEDSHKH
jgi:UDPglucose 6-dehydrogenase